MLEVSYTPKFRDFYRFLLYDWPRSLPHQINFLAFVGITSWIGIETMPEGEWTGSLIFTFLVMESGMIGIVMLLYVCLIPLFMFFATARNRKGKHNVSITDNCLIEESSRRRVETKWTGIIKLLKTKRLILAYVGTSQAHIIPRRIFETPGEFDLFFHEIETRFNAAKETNKD